MTIQTKNQQVIRQLEEILDTCDDLHIDIKITIGKRSKPQTATMVLAERLSELRDKRAVPFDIPVVAASDILLLPEFKGFSKRAVAGALNGMGCRHIGKDFATPFGRRTLWCCYDEKRVFAHSKKSIGAIYNREWELPAND